MFKNEPFFFGGGGGGAYLWYIYLIVQWRIQDFSEGGGGGGGLKVRPDTKSGGVGWSPFQVRCLSLAHRKYATVNNKRHMAQHTCTKH